MSTVLPRPDIRDFSHYLSPAPEDRVRMDFVVDGIHCAACARGSNAPSQQRPIWRWPA